MIEHFFIVSCLNIIFILGVLVGMQMKRHERKP